MVKGIKYLLLMAMICVVTFLSFGREDTETKIFDSRFKTLKTGVPDNFMSPPVIRLGSDEQIVVSFDEIGEDNSYLRYRLVHCNSDWQPSRLVESEYIEGFNNADIEDYAYSNNTFVHYVNYRITLPEEDMVPLVSGNYLLQVYDRDEPENTLLQTRFRVSEEIVGINATISTRTDRGVNDGWQQLSLGVSTDGAEVGNVYSDMLVEVMQNSRQETARFLRSPLRVDGSTVVYQHSPELIFHASNEYRRFETISTLFPGMRIDSLRYMGTNYHAWINRDEERADRNYNYDRTQHGRFMVREYNATDSDLGADYVTVHFTLDVMEKPLVDIYVDGEMTYGEYTNRNRMVYNREKGVYELQMPLKQGSYNYQYVVKDNGRYRIGSTSPIEGDMYETENEYSIAVYLRLPGSRYDRLIGFKSVDFN